MAHEEKDAPGGATPEELEAFAWWQERHIRRIMRRRYTRALIAYRLAKLPKKSLINPVLLARVLIKALRQGFNGLG
ncbi:hypothetical protein [Corynebacterium macginleyi]|uniref:hypothetical protein n=1 Tax=Corynebacterium macginleyi TaxID=38290 RepID=UPI00190E3749|nr:hypothetical protein [Corynebacterium macginleyi]MBK4161075.1 hypothetical protein [Corynebacterium macginleyi]